MVGQWGFTRWVRKPWLSDPLEIRVLGKLCQEQCRVYLLVTLMSPLSPAVPSVSTCPDPSVRDSAGW